MGKRCLGSGHWGVAMDLQGIDLWMGLLVRDESVEVKPTIKGD